MSLDIHQHYPYVGQGFRKGQLFLFSLPLLKVPAWLFWGVEVGVWFGSLSLTLPEPGLSLPFAAKRSKAERCS